MKIAIRVLTFPLVLIFLGIIWMVYGFTLGVAKVFDAWVDP